MAKTNIHTEIKRFIAENRSMNVGGVEYTVPQLKAFNKALTLLQLAFPTAYHEVIESNEVPACAIFSNLQRVIFQKQAQSN